FSGIFSGTGYHTVLIFPCFGIYFFAGCKCGGPKNDLCPFLPQGSPPIRPFYIVTYLTTDSTKIHLKNWRVQRTGRQSHVHFIYCQTGLTIFSYFFSFAVDNDGGYKIFPGLSGINWANDICPVLFGKFLKRCYDITRAIFSCFFQGWQFFFYIYHMENFWQT